MWPKYQLGNTVSRATEAVTLLQTERGLVEIGKGALAVPVMLDDQLKGYVFHGEGKLVLDTILETDEGAVGKPVEKELKDPFLMLGDTEKMKEHFGPAVEEEAAETAHGGQEALLGRAQDLLDRFFGDGYRGRHERVGRDHGFVFAFENETGKLDILVIDGSKMVYTSKDVVFVSNRGNEVLKVDGEIFCSKHGKSVIIKQGRSAWTFECGRHFGCH